MTQKTKLEPIGPYTPDHEGPYILKLPKLPSETYLPITIHCIVDGIAFISCDDDVNGPWTIEVKYIMNAREVPAAREFWINEYHGGGRSVYLTKEEAEKYTACLQRTIHVREVLPGEGV